MIASLFLLTVSCAEQSTMSERREIMFSTVVTLRADDPSAVDDAFAQLSTLEQTLNSDLDRLEHSDSPVEISADLMTILSTAKHYAALTDGAFDVTSGAVTQLWRERRVPTDDEITQALSTVGSSHLELDLKKKSARLDRGTKLDLGGIVKGYAADRALEIFKAHHVRDGLIDFGTSTIYAVGHKRVGIKNPRGDGIIKIVELEDKALSTSGDYETTFIVDGQRYHHLIDPRDGRPTDNGLASVSVVVDGALEHRAMIADILSTAAFVLGKPVGDHQYIFISSDK